MREPFHYSQKFDSFRDKTLFERLDQDQQGLIRSLAFQYQFSFQEFRQVVEASRDLGMWEEPGLDHWWEDQSALSKKELLQNLQAYLRTLKKTPKSYPQKVSEKTRSRDSIKIVTQESDKKIHGMCPVASPKTVCCNLKTIDVVENCSFGCSYCTIQTFYKDEAIFDANFVEKLQKIEIDPDRFYHFGTGQSSDSLIWGNRNGILDSLCQFANDHPNIMLEFKTKSHNIGYFLEHEVPTNIVCSWSLNTPTIIDNEEHFTANLDQRIQAARQVADRGVKVAFHFHPMVYYEGWDHDYLKLAARIMSTFDSDEVLFISLGSVTFIKPVMQKIRRLGNATKILQMELVSDPHGKFTYPDEIKTQMFKAMYGAFAHWQDQVFFYLCMEKSQIWEEVFGRVYETNESFEADFSRLLLSKESALT
jgi:spore photoproduct lyase